VCVSVHNPFLMDSQPHFPGELLISDYGYELPDNRIARYPLAEREQSKLLIWKAGKISEDNYGSLGDHLPGDSLLVFNNSRVIEARILFEKPSGGQIEIFCLQPGSDQISITRSMMKTGQVRWTCLIGGASKWKRGQILKKTLGDTELSARFIEKRQDDFIVEFSWFPESLSFEKILQAAGSIPLPPYLKRNAEKSDAERYQTVYAQPAGSVAAPTAGLHFTRKLIESLGQKGIQSLYLTLHVGAGTFLPVKTEKLSEHHMHEEFIEITGASVEHLLLKLDDPVIAVGTTSLRTLETLYWLGLKIYQNKNIGSAELYLDQEDPYRQPAHLSAKDALTELLKWIENQSEKKLVTKTRLFIVPGYRFRIVRGLITNFHQPNSTLLLLVAALIGPAWKSVYTFALDHDYRFLSYGDGCLFLP
jgi:S-adenosylmethionine:tRNA ribosyltransferase-isomerase